MRADDKYIQIAAPLTGDEELRAIRETLESGWLTQGPKVRAFEEAFAARHRARHALACTSGTTALHLALLAVGVGPGDTVVTPSFTWVATANAVEYCGARPVFCDSRREDYNLDPDRLAEVLDRLDREGVRPKAVIIAHMFGLMGDMKAVEMLAGRYGFKVVEDAACAAGAASFGRPAGSWGAVGCFSFHPRKIITTGEGGLCLTDDDQAAALMACLRNHGASPSAAQAAGGGPFLMADFNVLGYNYRMSDLQGAVGLAQLARLDRMIAERREMAAFYHRALADLDWFVRPEVPDGYEHSWQAYVGLVESGRERDEIMRRLHEAGIGSRAGTHAVHQLGYYRDKYGLATGDLPVAAALYARTLSLPLHNKMTEDDLRRVAETLKKAGGRI